MASSSEHTVRTAAGLQRLGDFRRRLFQLDKRARQIGGGQHAVADGGEVARAAAADRDAGQRAGEIGRRCEL